MEIIVLKGKHHTHYYKASSKEEKFASALKIFDNNRSYYNYPEEDKVKAELIDKTRSGAAALNFVWNRSYTGHEYEELEMETLE